MPLKIFLTGIMSFCGGLMVACGVFAFVAAVGVVTRIAYKTGTLRYARIYEEAIIIGGIFGCGTLVCDYRLPLGAFASGAAGLLSGVFFGSLTVCLAEVLYVMPILSRRARIVDGLAFVLVSFALGKLAGSLIYFFLTDM